MHDEPVDPFAQTWVGSVSISADDEPAASSLDHSETVPERYGRYRVLELVGEGGVGAVYLGRATWRS